MKTLNTEEMKVVSGAGHNADAIDPWAGKNKISNQKSNDPVADCNNRIIGGMITGSLGGVPELAPEVVGGAIAGGCFNVNSSSSSSSSSSSNNNSQNSDAGSDIGGQCHK